MKRPKHSILLIPPGGKRIRVVRIRFWIISAILLLSAGYAGFFIPLDTFKLTSEEKIFKKNLGAQNDQLAQRIIETRRGLGALDEQVGKLEEGQHRVEALCGIDPEVTPPRRIRKNTGQIFTDLGKLLDNVSAEESFIAQFTEKIRNNNLYFTSIPLIRPVEAEVSYSFGKRLDPFTGVIKWHNGIDYIAPSGAQVVATASGIVESVTNDRFFGRTVTIRHSFGFTTIYAHLGTIAVSAGKRINRGQMVATVGLSGMTTGPHLHYEVLRNGKAINPEEYLFINIDSLGQNEPEMSVTSTVAQNMALDEMRE